MKLPKMFILKNNFKVVLLRNPDVNSLTIQLVGKAGSNYEHKDEIGAAHMVEHLLLIKSKKYPSTEKLKGLITNTGGKIIGITSRDDVLFGIRILDKYLENGVEFLSEIFFNSSFSEIDLEKTKETVRHEIKRYSDYPEKLILRKAHTTLFSNQRLGMLNTGNLVQVQLLTLDNITKFKNRTYNPSNFILIISGNMEFNKVKKLCRKYFEIEVSRNKKQNEYKFQKNDELIINTSINKTYHQAYLRIDFYGYRIADNKKYYSVYLGKLTDTILKDVLVNKLSLAYRTNCTSYSAGSYGMFSIYLVTDAEKLQKGLSTIKEIINSIKIYITPSNINLIKNKIICDFEFGLEKTSERANYYNELILHGRKEQNHIYERKMLNNIKLKDIQNISEEIFSKNPKITILSNKFTSKQIETFWKKRIRIL